MPEFKFAHVFDAQPSILKRSLCLPIPAENKTIYVLQNTSFYEYEFGFFTFISFSNPKILINSYPSFDYLIIFSSVMPNMAHICQRRSYFCNNYNIHIILMQCTI